MWICFDKDRFYNLEHYSAIYKRIINDNTALIIGEINGEEVPIYGGSQSSCNVVFHNLKVLLQAERVEEGRRLPTKNEMQKLMRARELAREESVITLKGPPMSTEELERVGGIIARSLRPNEE